MNSQKLFGRVLFLFLVLSPLDTNAAELSLDLPAALQYALRENPELKAKRHALGIAQARAQQAGLLLQHNPRFSVEMETPASGKASTSVELNLLQEFEIAGQRAYRNEAAAKNLAQAQLAVADAERLLGLEVTQAYYQLLAVQQLITGLNEVLTVQENLLDSGQKRFAREDISLLELNTLRLDRDQVRNELANKMRERVLIEKQLRQLTALQENGSLRVSGDLLDLLAKTSRTLPDRQTVLACVMASRPDMKAAKLAVEVREAELRLAQARRIPNIAIGPRYKRDSNETLFGGEIAIPLPLFNRNQEEVATALANQNVSRAELEGRLLAAKQDIDAPYSKLAVAKETVASYGTSYLDELEKMLALTRKAYESGEMTIFEFSVTRDRFAQARARSLDAALAYIRAIAELEAQAPGCLK
jgi:cobalt-zinc-cadmium efflux system outer membrane protein